MLSIFPNFLLVTFKYCTAPVHASWVTCLQGLSLSVWVNWSDRQCRLNDSWVMPDGLMVQLAHWVQCLGCELCNWGIMVWFLEWAEMFVVSALSAVVVCVWSPCTGVEKSCFPHFFRSSLIYDFLGPNTYFMILFCNALSLKTFSAARL